MYRNNPDDFGVVESGADFSLSSHSWGRAEVGDEDLVSPVEALRSFFQAKASKVWRMPSHKHADFGHHIISENLLLHSLYLDAKSVSSLHRAALVKELSHLISRSDHFLEMTWLQEHPELFVGPKEEAVALVNDQLAFPLSGAFSPSKSLTEFWVRGVKALAQRADPITSAISLSPTQLEVEQEFAKTLVSLFGMTAQQLRYAARKNLKITIEGCFDLPYQISLCDAFLVIPYESGDFLHALKNELIESISRGHKISGAWGSVEIEDGEIAYVLNPPRYVEDKNFIRAQEIE